MVEALFPFGSGAVRLQTAAFGSGAVDPWPSISGRPEHNFAGHTGVYGVEVLCGFTDGEHEIRKPKPGTHSMLATHTQTNNLFHARSKFSNVWSIQWLFDMLCAFPNCDVILTQTTPLEEGVGHWGEGSQGTIPSERRCGLHRLSGAVEQPPRHMQPHESC